MPEKRKPIADLKREEGRWFVASRIINAVLSVPPLGDKNRTRFLMDFAASEPLLAGTIYTIVTRNTNYRFRLTGAQEAQALARSILWNRTWYGAGWHQFVAGISYAFLASDNGAWFEIVREMTTKSGLRVRKAQDDYVTDMGEIVDPQDVVVHPASLPEQLIPLDPCRCFPTGDPMRPLEYERADGRMVALEWWQCAGLVDQPIPGRTYGLCAVSRVLEAAKFMLGVMGFNNERVWGNSSREVVLTNVDARVIRRAMDEATSRSIVTGNQIYVPPTFVSTIDPSASPQAVKVSFADLPEGFNLLEFMQWYVTILALVTGTDFAFLAPLPGSRLGTATEAEVMARLSRVKAGGYFTGMLAHILNTKGILPRGVTISFSAADYTEELEAAKAALTRAQERAARIASGEITPQIARQLASDSGDLDEIYLRQFGESDILGEEN